MASRVQNSEEPQRNGDARFPCNLCSRSFKRLEHLSRHRQSHQDVKRFGCPVCFKRFARSDILLRHRQIHAAVPGPDAEEDNGNGLDGSGPGAGSRLTGRGSRRKRACQACAKAHESCSKGDPCQRCLARSTQCIYAPSRSESRQQGKEDAGPDEERPQPAETQPPEVPTDVSPVPAPESMDLLGDGDQAVPLLLGMHEVQPADDNGAQQMLPAHGFAPGGAGLGFAVPDPTASGRVDEAIVYNTWNPQGLPTDASTLNFPINWLPENLHVDLDYVSILGPILAGQSLLSTDINPPAASFQQMQMQTPIPAPAVEQQPGPLPSNLALGNSSTLPFVVHGGGVHSGGAALRTSSVTSPVTSNGTASEHTTPSSTGRLRNALPSSTPGRGHLYTTSMNGARMPCTARDKIHYDAIPGTNLLSPINDPNANMVSLRAAGPGGAQLGRLPSLNHITVAQLLPADDDAAAAGLRIWPSTYESIRQGIQQTYLATGEAQLFDDNAVPSREHLNYFVHLYFGKCNPILPILHEHVVTLNDSWLLALAVAAVGSQYTFTDEFTSLAGALHEILHRALLLALEADNTTTANSNGNSNNTSSLAIVQALFLSQIGLLYHGSPRLFRRAKANHSVLVDLLRCGMLLEPSVDQQQTRQSIVSSSDFVFIEQQWHQWVHEESRRCLGYAIWLFVEKHIKPDLGEFSRIILLHGVYQEIWQVKRYFDRPLSNWVLSGPAVPDDRPAQSTAQSAAVPVSTADNPTSSYSSWRNAACDCVDVLHWGANGMIAQLSGSEHTTVFHLHFSRVVLLTPFDEIRTLARYLASLGGYHADSGLGPLPTRSQGLAAERAVIEWAQQDEHKARLAVLHCGCFFWHIRRYSAMSFYEPVAVFMATLSIWAYSSYASQATNASRRLENPQGQGQTGHEHRGESRNDNGDDYGDDYGDDNSNDNGNERRSGTASAGTSPRLAHERRADNKGDSDDDDDSDDDSSDERVPSFIRLDRPNDDEMVQLFVRSGRPSVMRAYISGIGDICSPKAPVRILKEGGKILSSVSMAWGRTDRYLSVLTAMNAALAKLAEEW
ncbi:hypothetical protein SCUCBS95973_002791 [Sporothrix curviconia]|uniref:C2H2-type domain-containing protein n=1 Tax=Sporothrix curviconia TaxID=1260050 RepID=A0ABP0BA51_9PEZI